MKQADDTNAESPKSRRIGIAIQGDCMTLQVPRIGLSMLLALLAFVMLGTYLLVAPSLAPKRETASPRYEDLPGGGRIQLSPYVEFESADKAQQFSLAATVHALEPVLPALLAFVVYWISRRLFRVRIVLDRRDNTLRRGRRRVCALSDVASVELDDAPRVYVSNTLALILPRQKRLLLLLYDTPTDGALLRKAQTIAAFVGVPLKAARAAAPRKRE